MSPEKRALLSAPLRATLQTIAAAYNVAVEPLIEAALGRPTASGPAAAAKHLSEATLAELRALPWPEPAPSPPAPLPPTTLPSLAPVGDATPPDVVVTVDGVHLTCPCCLTHAELRARIAADIPHLVADEFRPLDLHLRRDGWFAPVAGKIVLGDGDVLLTHADPQQAIALTQHQAVLSALITRDTIALIDAHLSRMTVPVQPAVPRRVLVNVEMRERLASLEEAMALFVATLWRAFRSHHGSLSLYSAKVASLDIAPGEGFCVGVRCWLDLEVDAAQAADMVSAPQTPMEPLEGAPTETPPAA